MTLTIYHNPRCSKSRETLAILKANGIDPNIRLYLEDLLTETEITTLLGELGFGSARELMRKGEAVYRDLNLKNEMNESNLVKAMINHPKLIERPIVSQNGVSVLGRPPKNVEKLIKVSK